MIYDIILISDVEAQLIVDGAYLGLIRYTEIRTVGDNESLIPTKQNKEKHFIGGFTVRYSGVNTMFATGQVLVTDAIDDHDKYRTFLYILELRRKH